LNFKNKVSILYILNYIKYWYTIEEIKKLRGYFEGSATINQEYPNLPDNLIDKLADYFLGDYKLTDSDYVELGKYIKFDGI